MHPITKRPIFHADLQKLMQGEHYDPHSFLGLHRSSFENQKVIRLWKPGATQIQIELRGELIEPQRVHEAGLFEATVPYDLKSDQYRIYHTSGLLALDPYTFLPTLGEIDQYLFNKGVHYELYNVLGAHEIDFQQCRGLRFAVWAPSARAVSVVGDFNHWDGRVNPMRSMGQSGIWELFIPGLGLGEKYKFEIRTQTNAVLLKADPMAFSSELRPSTASVVADVDHFQWEDADWMAKRFQIREMACPMNLYEVHLGSWKKKNGHFMNYRQIAQELAAYCTEMGFTHVELMPVQEHPFDESWGYQVTGFYAVTSRFGTPQDFQWFVNYLHKQGIGVIMDWVPGHFPRDDFSLGHFDGTALYEHDDPRQGLHPHWSTKIFNLGRFEISNFLIANALFWLDKMHIDGLRVDAVASMLYLDYGRNPGEWIPNIYGGKENLESIEFFKHLNSIVHRLHPGVLMIAEESTSFPKVTHSVDHHGLGFDLKWNMGWMNDTLRYFSKDTIYRQYHQNDLTFALLYAFSERFILVLSHDEVVHGKNSLLGKMPGDVWQKFANLRLLYSYMICQPGKKLFFMGGEIGQWNEWTCKGEIEWFLLQFPVHHGIQIMVKELNHFYLSNSALWERDFDYTGFEWVDFSDTSNCVISYLRKSSHEMLLCLHNFTPNYVENYFIRLPQVASIQEVFNSDAEKYGGSGQLNKNPEIVRDERQQPIGLNVKLPPLATIIFKVAFW